MRLTKRKTEKTIIAQTSVGLPTLKLITVACHHRAYVGERGGESRKAISR